MELLVNLNGEMLMTTKANKDFHQEPADILSANLKKAIGITALINASTSSEAEVLNQDLEWASWALEDILREAKDAQEKISENEFIEMCKSKGVDHKNVHGMEATRS